MEEVEQVAWPWQTAEEMEVAEIAQCGEPIGGATLDGGVRREVLVKGDGRQRKNARKVGRGKQRKSGRTGEASADWGGRETVRDGENPEKTGSLR